MAYQRNPIKNAPSVNYNGQEKEPINQMHCRQQIHKYNIGLFVTGIIAMSAALITLIVLIASAFIAKGLTEQQMSTNALYKALRSLSTSTTIIFVIALCIDVVLTVMLNKYYRNKLPLILFIPALVVMVVFCVPELLWLLKLFGIDAIWSGIKTPWTSYIVIVVCAAFIVFELIRMIRHRDELNIYAEVKKALR